MKRGLVLLEPQEIPLVELTERITRLQRSMKQQGVAAAFIYGDVYRSADLTYLSNICIYWNEGIIAVPATGNPALLTKISSRVYPWMMSISNLKDLRSGPNLDDLINDYLREVPPGLVGLVEMDWWPATLVEDLHAKLSGRQLHDLGSIVQNERKAPSESELLLLRESAKISALAVASGLDQTLTNSERAGKAELTARMAGVEDVYVFCNPVTDQADTVEVFAEYRGYWTAAARVVLKSMSEWATLLLRAYEAATKCLKSGANAAKLRMAAEEVLVGTTIPWRLDLIDHTDLETNGDYRLPDEEKDRVLEGSVVGIRLVFTFTGGTQAVVADTFEIHNDGSTCLTKGLPEVFSK